MRIVEMNRGLNDPALREAALKAVGNETDAWKRAKILEKWVHGYVSEKNLGVGFASAKEVFETREGYHQFKASWESDHKAQLETIFQG